MMLLVTLALARRSLAVHIATVQPSPQPHPPPGVRQIPALTRRQAMDWSLVLASQGIEHIIGAALAHGEWWRLFTATWLHADLAHLAMNMVFGFLFLGLVMGRYGPGVGLLAAYLAGVGGNLAAWLVYGENHRGLGASGVVMGALGLLTIQSVSLLIPTT